MKRRTLWVSAPGVLGLLSLGAWLLFQAHPPYPGNPAPDVTVYSLQKGLPYRLAAFRGRWVFINFWTSWCPPCRDEFPALVRLWNDLRDDSRWVFLWVNVGEPEHQVQAFLQQISQQIQTSSDLWPVFLDPSGEAGRRFGVWAYPETFIIDPMGHIVERVIGPQAWDQPAWREKLVRLTSTPTRPRTTGG